MPYREARRNPELVVLEGLHALKHALRFGAEVLEAVAPQPGKALELAASLAPDLVDRLGNLLKPVAAERFADLAPVPHPTGVLAIARRPSHRWEDLDPERTGAPLLLLEHPTDHGNAGAAIRSAAAAGAGGVICVGDLDPWHPATVRGAAGLQFALPVLRADALPESSSPWFALDPGGRSLEDVPLPATCIFAFGTERHGLSEEARRRATVCLSLPMMPGVSSLNLATSVSVVLYAWRLSSTGPRATP